MENPNLRYSAYLALRHPFVSKNSEIKCEDLPRVWEPEKIKEHAANLKECLQKLLLINFAKKKSLPEKRVITIYKTETFTNIPSLLSIDTQDLQSEFKSRRKLQVTSSAIFSAKKVQIARPQRTHNVVAENFGYEQESGKKSSTISRKIADFTETLPNIDSSKKDQVLPLQSSSQNSESGHERKTKVPVSVKASQWAKFVSESPKKKDSQIKEILERIVFKEKEIKDHRDDVHERLTDRVSFKQTQMNDQKNTFGKNGYRKGFSVNFSSTRPFRMANTETVVTPTKSKHSEDPGIFELQRLSFTQKLKIKERDLSKQSKSQRTYKLGATAKKRLVNQAFKPGGRIVLQKDAGTTSTQDF